MSKSLLVVLLLLLVCRAATAQTPDDEYYPYAGHEEPAAEIRSDTILFYSAIHRSNELFARWAWQLLPQVALGAGREDDARVEGIVLPYRYDRALRGLAAREEFVPGAGADAPLLRIRRFRFDEALPLQPFAASVRGSNRNYRLGARFLARGALGARWRGAVAVDGRFGRDMLVEGVFTEELTTALRAERRGAAGSRLALMAVLPRSVRGTRFSSVDEAFALTGNRLYNPAWGYQNGRVRNARVRRETVPLVLAVYGRPLGAATRLSATLAVEAGVTKYSALGWYDARTPMPDNYRYLPSHTGDEANGHAWRTADPRYTQIDWDGMIAANRAAADGAARYALEDRVERICDVRLRLDFTTSLGAHATLGYGLSLRHDGRRSYKQMRDLLGGDRLVDIDYYLVDDDTYGNRFQNDLRHPYRTVRTGDRFGYDYRLTCRRADLHVAFAWQSDRLRVDLGLVTGSASIRRRGFYEKELFPGDRSYGPSRAVVFNTYGARLLAGWSFSPRSYLEAAVAAGAEPPRAVDLFYQPLYNNRTVDDPRAERSYAAQLSYRLSFAAGTLQARAYVGWQMDGTETRRYFDDMAGLYCDLAVEGVGIRRAGIELAADIRLSYRWGLTLLASAARSRHIRDPRITVLSDADNTAVDTRAVSHMRGLVPGLEPQRTAAAEVRYFGAKGWGGRCSAGYAGGRRVEPMPLRRTERIALQGSASPEAFDAFTHQERLRDAFTVDCSLFRTFRFGRSQLTASLIVRNLTGSQAVYAAYESLRVRTIPSGDASVWMPHPTRMTYAYPRSFYLSVSYRF